VLIAPAMNVPCGITLQTQRNLAYCRVTHQRSPTQRRDMAAGIPPPGPRGGGRMSETASRSLRNRAKLAPRPAERAAVFWDLWPAIENRLILLRYNANRRSGRQANGDSRALAALGHVKFCHPVRRCAPPDGESDPGATAAMQEAVERIAVDSGVLRQLADWAYGQMPATES